MRCSSSNSEDCEYNEKTNYFSLLMILNYANGVEDLSRPKGNILNFSDSLKENSYSYIIQIYIIQC